MKHPLTAVAILSSLFACGDGDPGALVTTGEVSSADDVPIRYEVRGSGDPTLVLLHGWTNDRTIWGQHPTTLARTHRVVALDLAGHGESAVVRSEWTIEAFAEDVRAVLDRLALEQVVLVGFSMGGAVALEAAERMPGRVLGVVIVDTLHDPEAPPPDPAQLEELFRANCCDTAFVRAFAFTADAPDSVVEHIARRMPAQPLEHWFPIVRAASAWTGSNLAPTLRGIQVPIAAINTTRLPTNVDAWRRYAPSFTVDTLEGVGHAGILLQRVGDFDTRLLGIVNRFREN